MKKIYTVLFFLAGLFNFPFFYFSSAQLCTPEPQYTKPGIYPDTLTDLDTAYLNVPYYEVITVVVPYDTIVPPLTTPVKVDSVIVFSISNLPPGLNYFCDVPGRCSFPGNTKGCVRVSGTPTTVGTYDITGVIKSYVAGAPFSTNNTLENYRLVVKAAQGINENNTENNIKIFPLPFRDEITISFFSKNAGSGTVTLYNAIGKEVYKNKPVVIPGNNKISLNLSGLPDGIYYLTYHSDGNVFTKRISKISNL